MNSALEPRYFGNKALTFPNATSFKMRSAFNGREYEMLVSEPSGSAPQGGFPLVVSLDADATFFPLAHALQARAQSPLGIDQCLLVSIRFPDVENKDPSRRYFEFTTSATPDQIPKHPKLGKSFKVGGAEEFLEFLCNELLPFVRAKIDINRKRTTLFGHSLAGFFTLFALQSTKNAFKNYAALSPSLWWANSAFLEKQIDWSEFVSKSSDKQLLIGVGANERMELISCCRKFDEIIRRQDLSEHYHYLEIANEDHGSVVAAFMSRVVELALGPGQRKPGTSPVEKLLRLES